MLPLPRSLVIIARAAPLALALVAALPHRAHAEDDEPSQLAEPAPQRTFGLGTAFGGGFSGGESGSGPALLLPTVELQFFTSQGYSVDVVMPVANMIVTSLALEGFVFSTDAYFNFNVGDGAVRLVAGPGLGFSVISADRDTLGTLRLPAELGFEVLTEKRGFGFKMLARPWAEFAFGDRVDGVGGGLLGAIAFSGYATK